MGFKSKVANRTLDSKLRSVNREKKVYNLDTAKTTGILWEIDQNDSFELIESELKKAGIQTTGLCYSHSKKVLIPETMKGFTRKHSNWYDVPASKLADEFIREKFDILIDLTGLKYFQLVYVTALSIASFKIGYSGNSANYFDFNIDFREQPKTRELAEKILYYLKNINKTTIE